MWQNRTGFVVDGEYQAVGATATELGKALQS